MQKIFNFILPPVSSSVIVSFEMVMLFLAKVFFAAPFCVASAICLLFSNRRSFKLFAYSENLQIKNGKVYKEIYIQFKKVSFSLKILHAKNILFKNTFKDKHN